MYHILGEIDNSCSYPDLFFSLENGKLANEQVASSVRNDVALNMLQVEHVCLNDALAKKLDGSIKAELKTLAGMNLVNFENGNAVKANMLNLLSLLKDVLINNPIDQLAKKVVCNFPRVICAFYV